MSNYSTVFITNLYFGNKNNGKKINFLITQYKATVGQIGSNHLICTINMQWLLYTVMIIKQQKINKQTKKERQQSQTSWLEVSHHAALSNQLKKQSDYKSHRK